MILWGEGGICGEHFMALQIYNLVQIALILHKVSSFFFSFVFL